MSYLTLDRLPRRVLEKLDLQTVFMASRCVVAAERLKLFRRLYGKQLTAVEIGRKVRLHPKRREFFLAALVGLGLLKKNGDRYRNTALADKYFVRERSLQWTTFFSEQCLREYEAFSVLEEMLITGKSFESILGIKRRYYVEQMKKDTTAARDFTYMLYHHHKPHARALARIVNLRKYRSLLDVAGGSGVISMALVRKYPRLKACVFDLPEVITVAANIIKKEGLSKRITTCAGDMTRQIPEGYDVIMMCDAEHVNHDTLGRIYDALLPGGLLILADFFSSEDLTEPFERLMWKLRSKEPKAQTRRQAIQMVRDCGYKKVKGQKAYGDLWLITGSKPG